MISSLMFIWLRSTLPQFASYLSSFKTDPSRSTTNLDSWGHVCSGLHEWQTGPEDVRHHDATN